MSEDLKSHDAHLAEEPETVDPQITAALGREVRFGLTLLGLLMAMLAVALYVKVGSPGLPWKQPTVAEGGDASDAAGAPGTEEHARAAATEPVPVTAHEAGGDSRSLWGDYRLASRHEMTAPPTDAPLPVGAAIVNEPPAEAPPLAGIEPREITEPAATAAETQVAADQNWPGSEAPRFAAQPEAMETAGQEIEKVGASDPFNALGNAELPAEPPAAGGPLIPESEVDLEPHPEPDSGAVQPTAAQEPPMTPPINSPYGRAAARDRYAPRSQEVEGPRAAPSAQHTPLNAVPEQQWNTPRSEPATGPHESELERELQESRTPHYSGAPQAPHNPGMSELDAPASEFAAPHDNIAGHQHQPGHVPTPDGTYTVEPNDSFWTISQKVYGTGGYFKAVQRHNRKPGDQADGLEIGEKILVPPAELLEQKYPQLCPKRRAGPGGSGRMVPTSAHGSARGGRVYVVEQGDTLFDIARFELGKASRWAEIYTLNRHQLGNDYNYVAPGTKLILPDDAASEPDTLTTRPGGPYAR